MPKTCQSVTNCTYNIFSHNYCKQHQFERSDDKWLKSSKGKITPKVKESSLKYTKSKQIKPISDKKLEELKEYRLLRDAYMKNHEVCEVKGCSRLAQDLHHMKGKIGKDLIDVRYFKALCRPCHTYFECHPAEAYEKGISLKRLNI